MGILFKSGGIKFSLFLNASVLGTYRDFTVTRVCLLVYMYVCVCVCLGLLGESWGRGSS